MIKYLLIVSFLISSELMAQNQVALNIGYGYYLSNSENATRVLDGKKLKWFSTYGFAVQRDNVFKNTLQLEYNYYQNTLNDVLKFNWTDESGNILGEFTGDYKLINHNFDICYVYNYDNMTSFGVGPSFVITNRIIDVKIPFYVGAESNVGLYDKLASSGIGISGFIRFNVPFNNNNDFIFVSKLKLRYTHSIWFDEGLRKLDDYNQEFLTAQLSLGIGFNFGD